jgi:uncharacterized protein YbcC (UPF0753/DUF2309 family)
MFDQSEAVAASPIEGAALRAELEAALTAIAPSRPVEVFVATNPLQGFEHLPFEQAVAEASALFGARELPSLADYRARRAAGKIDAAALDAAFAARFGDRTAPVAGLPGPVAEAALLRAHLDAGVDLSAAPSLDPAAAFAAAHAARWCAAQFDAGVAAWPLPGRERGLYACWRGLAAHDAPLRDALGAEALTRLLGELPETAADALAHGLAALGGRTSEARIALLSECVAALPGWTGFAVWASSAGADWRGAPADPMDLAALLIALRMLAPAAQARGAAPASADAAATLSAAGLSPQAIAGLDAATCAHVAGLLAQAEPALRAICLEAEETTFRAALLGAVGAPRPKPEGRPLAQAVFCIDVRSEPFRRLLEAEQGPVAPVETFGYAGFFGLALRWRGLPGEPSRALCPALLSPSHDAADAPRAGAEGCAQDAHDAMDRVASMSKAFSASKRDMAAPFALAESTGLAAGVAMALRTLAPRWTGRLAALLNAGAQRSHAYAPELAMSVEEKAAAARGMLQATGMGAPTARLLAVIGHGGRTVNNAYAAALDCGACGGCAGEPNAKAMAAILNDPAVRAVLAAEGLGLPADCVAIAGLHDTTTDRVTIFAPDAVPASHRADLAAFAASLDAAGAGSRRTRVAALAPRAKDAEAEVDRRAADWAETRPEWGLAGCAAFIVGPRSLTAGADLKGRCFLHSYDWRMDPEGAALTVILTAPMVVAHQIASQYFFSSVDPQVYGAGDKTLHNVVGGVGVLLGDGGDLRRGLPLQSTHDDDGRPHHDPMRLTAVVQAPAGRIDAVIASSQTLRRLFDGGWLTIVALDPERDETLIRDRDGAWTAAAPAATRAALPATGLTRA